eukprot:gene21434-28399_t
MSAAGTGSLRPNRETMVASSGASSGASSDEDLGVVLAERNPEILRQQNRAMMGTHLSHQKVLDRAAHQQGES